jgi:hypothetical protein
MTDAVAELLKQAKIIVAERVPGSAKSRQALNVLRQAPHIDIKIAGPLQFWAAMALRSHCLLYNNAPTSQRANVLQLITLGVDLVEALRVEPDGIRRHWVD